MARKGYMPWGEWMPDCVIGNLTRAFPYSYTFRAVSAVGEGIDSVAAGRKLLYFETPADYAIHMTNLTIVGWGARWAKFTWDYPADDGGKPVISYQVLDGIQRHFFAVLSPF